MIGHAPFGEVFYSNEGIDEQKAHSAESNDERKDHGSVKSLSDKIDESGKATKQDAQNDPTQTDQFLRQGNGFIKKEWPQNGCEDDVVIEMNFVVRPATQRQDNHGHFKKIIGVAQVIEG